MPEKAVDTDVPMFVTSVVICVEISLKEVCVVVLIFVQASVIAVCMSVLN